MSLKIEASRDRIGSTTSSSSSPRLSKLNVSKMGYRVVLIGPRNVGKTSIVSQFLYDQFSDKYEETVEEMYRGEFDLDGEEFAINIQDTGGSYIQDFPAMMEVSLAAADAVILVFSLNDPETFQDAKRLWVNTLQIKSGGLAVLVVGNKLDLGSQLTEEDQCSIQTDWGCTFL
ncbi:GTP-binding protein Rhes, partial [Eurytemora carolleeae]|uniref:GTP-binding protein Rhes n=1 Tax=Eurytemora carolleeae TaxID=1294199 RepID=UPI000C764A2B